MNHKTHVLVMGLAAILCGCGLSPDALDSTDDDRRATADDADAGDDVNYSDYYGSAEIRFFDDVQSNINPTDSIAASISFVDLDGTQHPLESYYSQNDVVLVVTRGNTNPICPYCSTQTSNLISSYQQFVDRGAEVVLVYPIEASADQPKLDAFLADARSRLSDPSQPVPFPVLVDPGLSGIDRLGIRADLARPATYIIDRNGDVRFGYVGSSVVDRPSVEFLLNHLDELHPDPVPFVTPDTGPIQDSSDESGEVDASAPVAEPVPAVDS